MSYPFKITRDDIKDYCVTRYFPEDDNDLSSDGFYVSTGDNASMIVWPGFAQIVGGPELTKDILACKRQMYPLKELALRVVSESVASNPDQLLDAIDIAKKDGKLEGCENAQATMRAALGIRDFNGWSGR